MLEAIPGYISSRTFIAPSPRSLTAITPAVGGILRVARAASGYDLLHVHGEVASALCLPAFARCPSIVTLHGLNLLRRTRGVRTRLAQLNLRTIIRAADRTICVSRGELDDIRAVSARLAEKCELVPNGVDLPHLPDTSERRAARAALGVPDGTMLAVWVGALDIPKEPRVAVNAVIAAARRGASLRLAIVGDGPLRRETELAASEDRAVVDFHGHCTDVRPFMAAGDIFVLSSAREGLPFSLLEAMAMGLSPVVAVGRGGIEDVVHGAGTAVRHGDHDALAQALLELATSPELRARLGEAARTRVAERFGAERMRAHTRSVYDRVVVKRHGTLAS